MHKNRQGKGFSQFLHSWWFGVALLLLLIILLAINQKKIPPTQQDKVQQAVTNQDFKESRTNAPVYGVALADGLYNAQTTERMATLNKLKKAGFTEVRLGLSWDSVEPRQGQYNWLHLDNMMKAVKKSDMSSILLANTTPTWAREDVCRSSTACPPKNPEDYAKFMAAVVQRYKEYDVSAWEIWNEENGNNFWKPQPSPEQYAELLKTSYSAIKKVNPKATVLLGGLSGDSVDLIGPNLIDPRTYLTKLYASGIHGYYDGLAYHPYVGIGSIDRKSEYNGWTKMNTNANNIRDIMKAHGDENKDIWITEFGMPTGGAGPVLADLKNSPTKPDHVTPEVQAQVAQDVVDSIHNSPWIRSIDWWTYADGETAATNTGAAYGIWKFDGQPKPMLEVLQKAMYESRNKSSDTSAK